MRQFAALTLLLTLSGCHSTRSCKSGTVLLSLSGLNDADSLAVTLTIDQGNLERYTVPLTHTASAGTIEIDFAGRYPSGQILTVSVDATRQGLLVASIQSTTALSAGCTVDSIALHSLNTDLGIADLSAPDQSTPDLAISDGAADLTSVDFDNVDLINPCLPTADGPRFVNNISFAGVDDDQHGGAQGLCAYRTLDYALAHSPGLIYVEFTSIPYVGNFVLSGRQQLNCNVNHSMPGQLPATIKANGGYAVQFNGTANSLIHCIVVGSVPPVASTVVIATDGDPLVGGHVIDDCDISKGSTSAVRVDVIGHLTISNSALHDNSGYGVYWKATGSVGTLTNNRFSKNGTQDILCGDFSPILNGTGNQDLTLDGSTQPTCTVCKQCGMF